SARTLADAPLIEQIRTIHPASRGPTACRGSTPNWRARGPHAGASASPAPCGRQRWSAATIGAPSIPRNAIRARRQRPTWSSAPHQLWIADITYVPTLSQGGLYLAVILEVFRRRVVGWSRADHLRAELVVARWRWRSGIGVQRTGWFTIATMA